MKDWILDRWDARPKHLGRWVVGFLTIPLLLGGGAVGYGISTDPETTSLTSTLHVRVPGKVVTENGVVKVKVPPRTVMRKGKTVLLPGKTVPLDVFLQGPTITTTRNGTVFVTRPGPTRTVTSPTRTVTTIVTTPGGTITLPPVTVTDVQTQTITDVQTTVVTVQGPPVTIITTVTVPPVS